MVCVKKNRNADTMLSWSAPARRHRAARSGSGARHPSHGLNELAPAFFSDCDDLVEAASAAGVAAWIFGHHHWSLATETRGVRLLSAQLGYPGEDTGWTGPGYLEI
jgi:hypothetical protein